VPVRFTNERPRIGLAPNRSRKWSKPSRRCAERRSRNPRRGASKEVRDARPNPRRCSGLLVQGRRCPELQYRRRRPILSAGQHEVPGGPAAAAGGDAQPRRPHEWRQLIRRSRRVRIETREEVIKRTSRIIDLLFCCMCVDSGKICIGERTRRFISSYALLPQSMLRCFQQCRE